MLSHPPLSFQWYANHNGIFATLFLNRLASMNLACAFRLPTVALAVGGGKRRVRRTEAPSSVNGKHTHILRTLVHGAIKQQRKNHIHTL